MVHIIILSHLSQNERSLYLTPFLLLPRLYNYRTMSSTRARRSTVKQVDYSKEQQFSDEDLFEEDEDEPPQQQTKAPRRSRGGGRPRKQNEPAAVDDDDMYKQTGGHVYTEKGYDPSLPPIRDRFNFLPEYEEDGSPKIELIVGRRPVDEKEHQNEPGDEDDNDAEDEQPPPTKGRRKTRGKDPSPQKANDENNSVVEYEYLIKYRGRSYLHLEYKSGADLESMNKSAKGIYRRYLKKLTQGLDDELESTEFDPSYIVPEKIVDEKDQEIQIELSDKELLKWEKEREKEIAEEEAEAKESGETDEEEKKEADAGDNEKKGVESPTDPPKGEYFIASAMTTIYPLLTFLLQKKPRRLNGLTKWTSRTWTSTSCAIF